ncbi:MAG: ATP-binding cassette domain-containing protein [Defluviitaleaceae bacterium]|nr:ATP-binding cassette domain-containing protein [Defluviitaleaceae bacterium]
MLEVKNLTKTYAARQGVFYALKNVSITVNKGEIFGFIGLSGAGKTSLARCVSALERADSGEILLSGVDITKLRGARLREARKKMGLVFQHFNLLMNSTVFENIAFPLRIAGKSGDFIKSRVNELLETVGLTEKSAAYPATLSGGQKQRVGIARALAAEPELVICDEATSALDPDTTRGVLSLIKKIGAETGVTFLVITHEMDVIKEICTHVAVMENGEIIESGRVLDVLTQPKTDTAKRFFSKEYVDKNWLDATTPSKHGGRVAKICRATFIGDTARRGFIYGISKKFDIELSILSGNIESVGGTMVGSLILELLGDDETLAHVLKSFAENGVQIEALV